MLACSASRHRAALLMVLAWFRSWPMLRALILLVGATGYGAPQEQLAERLRPGFAVDGSRTPDAAASTAASARLILQRQLASTDPRKLYQNRRPPPPPPLPPRVRAGYDTVTVDANDVGGTVVVLRQAYEQCVRRVALGAPPRASLTALQPILSTRCGQQAAAFRAAIVQREQASPAATRLADEAIAEAASAAVRTSRTLDPR